MKSLLWEHFESAVGYFPLSVVGVLHATISLSFVRNYHLNMAFRTKGATLQQGNFVFNTTAVYISTGLDVVQSIGYHRLTFEKLVIEYLLGSLGDLVEPSFYVSLESRIHLGHCSCCSGAFRLTKMLFSEEELSVKVGCFDVVRISHHNTSVLLPSS